MRRVGDVAITSMKDRVARGINVNDQQAKALNPSYAKQKSRAGARPLRDMRLTGATLEALTILEATDTRVVIGFNDERVEIRAHRSAAIEPMLGLSPADKRAVFASMQAVTRISHRSVVNPSQPLQLSAPRPQLLLTASAEKQF